MSRLLLTAIPIMLLAGCPVDQQADRTAVTDELRIACPGASDAEIRALLIAAESSWLDGYPRTWLIEDVAAACGANFVCTTCGLAVIDQVYQE